MPVSTFLREFNSQKINSQKNLSNNKQIDIKPVISNAQLLIRSTRNLAKERDFISYDKEFINKLKAPHHEEPLQDNKTPRSSSRNKLRQVSQKKPDCKEANKNTALLIEIRKAHLKYTQKQ